MAGIEEKLSVSFFAKRALDGKVIVEEKVARHQDHRHAVDAPFAGSVVDVDRDLRPAQPYSPQTSFSRRTQFSPITLRMRDSFQPRFCMAAVRFG